MTISTRVFVALLAILAPSTVLSDDAPLDATSIKTAIEKSIPLLEKGATGSANERTCFTCHSQALPVMALAEARTRGFTINEKVLRRQVEHTIEHLRRGEKGYLESRGQGGRALSAGYALWTLEAGERESDEVTAAVCHYLLQYQKEQKHWSQSSNRPPTSGSDFTATYVALRGLAVFGTEQQQRDIAARKEEIGKWLSEAKPEDNEDRVFRLRVLEYVDADKENIQESADDLLSHQREDGGWAQKADMDSDAYATATALVALLRAGKFDAASDARIRRGVEYLLKTQQDDGSWHVKTRAKRFQKHFDSGFPHGNDQFISIAASSWATIALTLATPDAK